MGGIQAKVNSQFISTARIKNNNYFCWSE